MPRIYDSASDPMDFCKWCFPEEAEAEELYGDVTLTGEGPDGRGNCFGWEAEHPPYSDTDYTCDTCGKTLTDEDN
jgi:hypothetical protein